MVNTSQSPRRRWTWFGYLAALLALMLTACLPEGTRVPESPLLASLERKSGLIVYTGNDGNIYTVNQAGGNQSALTDDAGIVDEDTGESVLYELPVWSPDASQIAFARLQISNQSVQQASLMLAGPDGKGLTETYTTDEQLPIYLYWSPDGERLSFISTTDGASSNLMLQIIPRDGGSVEILDAGSPYYWSWSPDSSNLLVHVGNNNPNARLSFLALDNGVLESRLDLVPWAFNSPAWSPDGEHLMMAIEPEPNASRGVLALTTLSGQVEQELAEFENSVAFAWSPDGDRIAYIAGRSEITQINIGPLTVLDPEKPDEAITTPEEENVMGFFWSPDGRKIAYFEPVLVQPSALQGDDTGNQPPPDEEQDPILFVRLRVLNVRSGESRDVVSFQPTEDFYAMLLNFDQHHRSSTIWSPDSENIAIAGLGQEGVPSIWVLAASGNLTPRHLADGRLAFWSSK